MTVMGLESQEITVVEVQGPSCWLPGRVVAEMNNSNYWNSLLAGRGQSLFYCDVSTVWINPPPSSWKCICYTQNVSTRRSTSSKHTLTSMAWGCTPVIQVLWRTRQEEVQRVQGDPGLHHEYPVTLGFRGKLSQIFFKKTKSK